MGITKKQLLAQCSPDTLQASAKALAELDGERTIVAELHKYRCVGRGGSAATGRTVGVLALPPSANTYWRYGPNGVHVSPGGAGLQGGRQAEGAAPGHGADGAASWRCTSTCTVNARRATWTTSQGVRGWTERRWGMARR